jgi:hypothetical protein
VNFITEWITLKPKILTDIKIRFKKNNNFFIIGPVVFAPGTQTYAIELKKLDHGIKACYQEHKHTNTCVLKQNHNIKTIQINVY